MGDPFDHVRAQPLAVEVLRRAVRESRLPSAYLFEGPGGVGKERCALALATAVIGEAAGARIAKGAHPDVRVFRPRDEGARNLPVEVLREEIRPYAEFAPFEASHAFLVFPEADVSFPEAHQEAANALLKTLEEPKRGVHFVLLSERPERLLPTIRSRSQRLRFERLPDDELGRILREHAERGSAAGDGPSERDASEEPSDPTVWPAAIALADGRADRALALAREGAAAALLALAEQVDDALHSRRPAALLDAADALAKHEELTLALDCLVLFYRDIAAAAAGAPDEALRFRHAASSIRGRARQGARVAAERSALLLQIPYDLAANANRGIAFDAVLHRMSAIR
ncbi:MAG: AAA family ATPase [Myxococcales bacterium]|nr:AAA family ATPase [Myxococcales bacterium]